jgi:exonuclease SbcC
MHVTRVELENIKSYESADFKFGRGTTAITGRNGAGKTTILEAISWALFDTLEYSKEDFLRRGAKKGIVRVTFESDVDERRYVVYRDTGTGYYVYDPALGVRLAEKKVDVSALLRKLLGIEPGTDVKSLFRSAIGVPQGTFTAEFLLPANARKAAFDRLLKVEEYREGAERLRETVNLIRERIAQARERIAGAEGQLVRYEELVAEHKDAEVRVKDLDTVTKELISDIEKRSGTVAEMDAAETAMNEARAKAERLQVHSEAATERLRELNARRDDAAAAAERRRSAEADYRTHLQALSDLNALEARRAARDNLRLEYNNNQTSVAAAALGVQRHEDALNRALGAAAAIEALSDDIHSQEEIEKERERLRDLRARAISERNRLSQLDAELDNLRSKHAEIKAKVRAAEEGKGANERAEQLESERLGAETALSNAEKASTSLKHLRAQRAGEAKEAQRLRKEIDKRTAEIAEIERNMTRSTDGVQALAREQELTEKLARLRAEIARDEKFHSEVKNGLCPILSQRCLNIGEDQTLEDYFKTSFAANTDQLTSLETERTHVAVQVKEARDAERHLARAEGAQDQLATERNLLAQREAEIALIDREIDALSDARPETLQALRLQVFGIDSELKDIRAKALRYAGLEPLLKRLSEIEEEGKRKRDERESVSAAAEALGPLEKEFGEIELKLSALNDPRARAAALRIEAGTAEVRRTEVVEARAVLSTLKQQADTISGHLAEFADLDDQWNRAAGERDRTVAGHREFLASDALASTLPALEVELAAAVSEASRLAQEVETARKVFENASACYNRDEHAQTRIALSTLRERAASTEAQLEAARSRESALVSELTRLEDVRKTMREQFREKERFEALQEATEFIRDTLKTAGPLVTESYLYNISVEANQLFREITGEAARTLRWSRDYEILLEEDGHERAFQNLSGGEQMVAALSIRMAILKQLSDIRLAFFDEPTVNMDAERRERLAQQIGQIRHFDQLFVISHDDTFEESVDHIVHVAGNGESIVTTEAAASH